MELDHPLTTAVPRRFNLGHLYTSALVLLAHRLVNLIWPEEHKEEVERLTIASLRKVMDYFVVRASNLVVTREED